MYSTVVIAFFAAVACVATARLGDEAKTEKAVETKFSVESDTRSFLLKNTYFSSSTCSSTTSSASNSIAYPLNYCRSNSAAASGSQFYKETCDGVESNSKLTVVVTYYQDSGCTLPTHTSAYYPSTACTKDTVNTLNSYTYRYSATFPAWKNGHYSADFATNDYYCSYALPWQYNYTANNACETLSSTYSSQIQYCSSTYGVVKAQYTAGSCPNNNFQDTVTYSVNYCRQQDYTYKTNYCVA